MWFERKLVSVLQSLSILGSYFISNQTQRCKLPRPISDLVITSQNTSSPRNDLSGCTSPGGQRPKSEEMQNKTNPCKEFRMKMSRELSYVLIFVLGALAKTHSLTPALDIHAVVITSEFYEPRSTCIESDFDNGIKQNSTLRLKMLREELIKNNISAYIILPNDEHQSEAVSDHDKRLKYISGFSGSNGIAVVTLKSAALWTDSRYFQQAVEEMDCNWMLMKMGVSGTPTIENWLISQLKPFEAVSSDPKICSYEKWTGWEKNLEKSNITMKVVKENLIDRIWKEGRPPNLNQPVFVLDTKFAGLSWKEKFALIRDDMKKAKVEAFVVTALDEIAWALNLRGGDIPFYPVFRSYLVIEMTKARLYIHKEKLTPEAVKHLNCSETGQRVMIKRYEEIWDDLTVMGQTNIRVGLPSKYSYFGGISYLLHFLIPKERVTLMTSPILIRKAHKNPVEVAGMRASHVRDAVAVCNFLSLIEEEVIAGKGNWTELKAVEVLDGLRRKQKYNVGLSFSTIAAFGKNAAHAHYHATLATNAVIDTTQVFMLDSGGQYYDGTTDVTRTVHFGTPREIERDIYTRLLIGCINVVTTVFKAGYTMKELEIMIRAPLYEVGLDYGHGSTHGVGSFLAVHEAFNTTYHPNFFGSQEPGYYKENEFGMRLENIVTVVKAPFYEEGKSPFYTFDTITMLPYERKLIKLELLERKHINWINKYHEKVRSLVGPEILKQGNKKAYQWLLKKTEPISCS